MKKWLWRTQINFKRFLSLKLNRWNVIYTLLSQIENDVSEKQISGRLEQIPFGMFTGLLFKLLSTETN